MALNARTKGASGEREFCDWLAKNFNIKKPERNLDQVREGGTDILCKPFAFEVKRVETQPLLQKWWTQCWTATNDIHGKAFGLEPVVAFRRNGKDWEFIISAKHIGVDAGYIHMPAHVWKTWAKKFLAEKYFHLQQHVIEQQMVIEHV